MCASQTLLWTKTSLDVILTTLAPPRPGAPPLPLAPGFWEDPHTLAIALGLLLVGSVVAQLYCLNRALHYQLPVLIIPVFYTLFTCLSLASTLVVQQTFPFSPAQSMGILVGMVAIIVGVWMLAGVHEEGVKVPSPLAGSSASVSASPRRARRSGQAQEEEEEEKASGPSARPLLPARGSASSLVYAERLLQEAESLM